MLVLPDRKLYWHKQTDNDAEENDCIVHRHCSLAELILCILFLLPVTLAKKISYK